MIQLATDPSASRQARRAAAAEAKEQVTARRSRNGHAWPFISRFDERAAGQQKRERVASHQSGS